LSTCAAVVLGPSLVFADTGGLVCAGVADKCTLDRMVLVCPHHDSIPGYRRLRLCRLELFPACWLWFRCWLSGRVGLRIVFIVPD
jgi:hypothetical protein